MFAHLAVALLCVSSPAAVGPGTWRIGDQCTAVERFAAPHALVVVMAAERMLVDALVLLLVETHGRG